MSKELIILDMDGVLVDFCKAAYAIHGKEQGPDDPNHFDFFEDWGIDADAFWEPINNCGPDWWAELPIYPWAEELVEAIKSRGDFIVATACSTHAHSSMGKVVALQRLFGPKFRKYCITPCKHFLAAPGRILIDDYEDNRDKFEKGGGNVVLFPQPWNENRGFKNDPLLYTLQQIKAFDYAAV